jgi:hypothetical protein
MPFFGFGAVCVWDVKMVAQPALHERNIESYYSSKGQINPNLKYLGAAWF